jgi:thiol:disulfide interchange protein
MLTSDDLSVHDQPVLPSAEVAAESRTSTRTAPEPVRGHIQWQGDLRRAQQIARSDGKLIVADVYTDWCGWCKKMDETIYSDPTIVGLSRQEVFLKVNAEDRGQGQQFARQMGVSGYPTTIVLDSTGRVLAAKSGYMSSPNTFLNFVEQARAARDQ